MSSSISLASTHHDPYGRLLDQLRRVGPSLFARYSAVHIVLSPTSHPEVRATLEQLGGIITTERVAQGGPASLGATRRDIVAAALTGEPDSIHFCDLDRALHWADRWPAELDEVVMDLPNYDFIILGRTDRAFLTHPRIQRETEAQIHEVYRLCTGRDDDVTAASRGLRPAVARWLLEHDSEQSVGVDCTWPMRLLRGSPFMVTFRATDGLEYETADAYEAEIEAAGSYTAWWQAMSRDPEQHLHRIRCAFIESEAAVRVWRG